MIPGSSHPLMYHDKMATVSMKTNHENNYFDSFLAICHTDRNQYTTKLIDRKMNNK